MPPSQLERTVHAAFEFCRRVGLADRDTLFGCASLMHLRGVGVVDREPRAVLLASRRMPEAERKTRLHQLLVEAEELV